MNKDKDNKKKSSVKYAVALIALIVVGVLSFGSIYDSMTIGQITPMYTPYQTLKKGIENKEIFALYIESDSKVIRFQYNEDIPEDIWEKVDENKTEEEKEKVKDKPRDPGEVDIMDLDKEKWYYTNFVETDTFNDMIRESGISVISGRFTSKLKLCAAFLLSVLPFTIFVTLMFAMLASVSEQIKLGDNKYEVSKDTGVHFTDVIGHDEVIDDIKNYVKLLQNSAKLKEMKVKPPKGILFTGAPGTGKTLMAKAMAQEAGVPFIYLNTSSVIELFVGQGAKAIRSTFKKARELAPCIVFLDEIDAIGTTRGRTMSSSEDTQTLLALLQELDGFKEANGILVIAATNAPDTLDPALKRSGRFDREIMINLPQNRKVRKAMLEHYTKDFKLAEDVDLDKIAATLAGMSGADIANICNEAATQCALREENNLEITTEDFTVAVDKLLLKGNKLKNKSLINEKDRELVAYHEAGHAVTSYLLGEPVSRISIQGTTSGVGGFVLPEDKDTQFQSKSAMLNRIKICYGGRASEIIKYGLENATQGASNDIEQATKALLGYVGMYGFDDELGMLSYNTLLDAHSVDKTLLNERLRTHSAELFNATKDLLTKHYNLVEALATALLENETMLGSEAIELLQGIDSAKED